MAKSMRSNKKKRLRTIRREIAEPYYEKKELAKLAVQEAALAAPKVPVKVHMSTDVDNTTAIGSSAAMDIEMAGEGNSTGGQSDLLKPSGGVGKKKKPKLKKGKKFGKGKGKKFRKRKI